ncbi:adenosine receptor A1-like [Saccoglossus kowalevskii]|uniref:Adenosine receptor A2a-like n=1 Tax=Saccoglossus kowalevskii TaxID=10224 RepID=A0ABM0GPP8_SACKO|nr:PREDICTED: adenosine receptor A2a-like [Saccoglossus kowalevskii]
MASFPLEFYINLAVEIPVAIIAIGGNFLVCWAVYRNKHLRCVTNYFIVSLAVADLSVGLFAIPFALVTSVGLPEDFYSCLLMNCFVIIMTQSSIFSLLAIAIDRYFAVISPLEYRSMLTGRRALVVILITWFLAFFIGLVPVMGWNLGTPPAPRCYFTEVIDMKYMVYFNFFLCVLTPLILMIIIYIRIFRKISSQLKKMAATYANQPDAAAKHLATFTMKEAKTAKSLAVIMLLFAISWLPLHILNCIDLFCDGGCHVPYPLLLSTIMLSHANSAMNPVFYAFSNKEFRYTFRKLLGRLIKCHLLDTGNDKRRDPNAIDTDFSVSFTMQDIKSTFQFQSQRQVQLSSRTAVMVHIQEPPMAAGFVCEQDTLPPGIPSTPPSACETVTTRLDSANTRADSVTEWTQ